MNERLNAIVGARISEFRSRMAEVRAIAQRFASENTIHEIGADIDPFESGVNRAQVQARAFEAGTSTRDFTADISNVTNRLALLRGQLATFEANDTEVDIDADTSGVTRGVTRARAMLNSLRDRWVEVRVRHDRFRRDMDRIADAFRDINVVGAEMGKGILTIAIPALATLGAGAIAAVGTAGVQVGVLAGGLLGLASSFSVAAMGAVGLGAVMIPTISRISDANSAIKAGEASLSDYSKPMQTALKGLFSLQKAYKAVNQAVEPYVLRASGTAMSVLGTVLTAIQPGIVGVAKSFETLMTDLKNVFANSEDVKASIKWFNDRAGKAVEAWAKIAGYAFRGFINLMRAFDPLAKSTEQGLLNMTKRFSEWAAGLGKSEKFKAFIEYVKENGPKLLAVFGNITVGLVNMFAAFGPLAADMMTGFQQMTARFKEWSANLGQNEGFKSFVNYVRENGPQMRELIANVVNVGIQLAAAFGRVGEKMLPIINNFLQWTASMLKANPVVGNVLVSLITLMGAFKLFAPVIATFRLLFGGAFKFIWNAFAPFRSQLLLGLKMLGTGIKNFGIAAGKGALKVVTAFGKMIAQAAVWVGKMAAHFAKFVARYAWLGAKALVHAARVAASFVVAMGPIGWVIATVVALVALIILNWDKVSAWTKKAWSAMSEWVKKTWSQIWSKTKEITANVVSAVKSKFEQAKQAVADKLKSAYNAAKNAWDSMLSWTKNAAQSIYSFVRDKFQATKDGISNSLSSAKSIATNIWNSIKSFISNSVESIRNAVSNKFQAAKDAISNKLQSAKSSASNIVNSMKSSISNTFESIRSGVSNKIDGVKSAIKTGLNNSLDFVKGLGSSFLSAGKGLIEQMAQGIRDSIGKVTSAVSSVAQKARDFLPFSPAKTGPLSDIDKLNFGGPIASSIKRDAGAIQSALGRMLALPEMGTVSPSLASFNTPSYGGSSDNAARNGVTNNNGVTNYNTIQIDNATDDVVEEIKRFFGTFEQSAKQM